MLIYSGFEKSQCSVTSWLSALYKYSFLLLTYLMTMCNVNLCFDAVGWAAGRAPGLKNRVARYWHGYRSGARCICIWSSWCHCHPIISCFIKIQNGLPFWCRLTQVILEKRPLNRCSVGWPPSWLKSHGPGNVMCSWPPGQQDSLQARGRPTYISLRSACALVSWYTTPCPSACLLVSWYENVMSSIKPEVHNISQCHLRRTKQRLQATCTFFSSYASG